MKYSRRALVSVVLVSPGLLFVTSNVAIAQEESEAEAAAEVSNTFWLRAGGPDGPCPVAME